MSSKRGFLKVTTFLSIACILVACGDVAQNSTNRLGQELSNLPAQLGGALVGKTSYVLVPGFYEKLNPWIVDQAAFSSFVEQHREPKHLSDKENIDVIIQLGIVKYKPEWLTPRAQALIDKAYPGFRTRRAGLDRVEPVQLARNSLSPSETTVDCCDPLFAQAALAEPPALLLQSPVGMFAAGSYVEAIGFVSGLTVLDILSGGLLTVVAVAAILEVKNQMCAQMGGCTQTEQVNATVGGSNGNCTPDQKTGYQNRVENACGAAVSCTGGDSPATLGQKLSQASRCIDARRVLNNVCFGGGDAGHNQAIDERSNQIRNCQRLMAQNGR